MVTVHFLPANRSITVASGTTILEAARLAGILIESPCNGAVSCGKCTVHLDPDSLKKVVRKGIHHLSRREERAGQVLSCEAEVMGDISVSVPEVTDDRSLKITSHGHAVAVPLAPYIVKEYLAERDVTLVYHGTDVAAEEEGDTSGESFGVVVDIGTTTLVASLVDLNQGVEVESAAALNPQSRHAQDVLSRIRIASEKQGLAEMRDVVVGEINRLIAEVAGKAGVRRER